VAENGRGGGRFALGYALWRAFEDLKVNRVYLEVVAKNVRARKLYERAGFRAEGFFRDGYRADDGTFHDMVPYAMLARDPRHSLLNYKTSGSPGSRFSKRPTGSKPRLVSNPCIVEFDSLVDV
jgi:Acetyltransferase (GNAT) family